MKQHSRYQQPKSTFSRWFPKKRYIQVISARRTCKLSYAERIVYSQLVFRTGRGEEMTQAQLVARLKIREKRTVKAALQHLETLDLARCRERWHWSALEPPPELAGWFAYNRRTEEPWCRRFSTYKVCRAVPANVLTIHEEAVWFLLLSKAEDKTVITKQTKSGLAAMLNISLNTAKTSLKKLEAKKLVKAVGDGFQLLAPTQEVLSWFADVGSKPESEKPPGATTGTGAGKRWPTQFRIKETDPPDVKELKGYLNTSLKAVDLDLEEAGISEEQAREYWSWVRAELGDWSNMESFVTVHFRVLLKDAVQKHDPSRAPNCLALLKAKSQGFFREEYLLSA